MAIQLRRGAYADFDPTKMVPAEVGIVTSGDPNTDDGKAAYVAFSAGNAKRLATVEDIATDLQEATDDAVGQATARAEAAAESVEASAAQIATNTADIADLKADLEQIVPGLSEEAKEALLACFAHVAWIDDDGQDYYDALEEALYAEPVGRVFVWDGINTGSGIDGWIDKDNIIGLTNPTRIVLSGGHSISPGSVYVSENNYTYNDSGPVPYLIAGRATSRSQIIVGDLDGATVGLSAYTLTSGASVTFALWYGYFNENDNTFNSLQAMSTTKYFNVNYWYSSAATLPSDASKTGKRFLLIAFKKGDGSTDFTQAELDEIPSLITISEAPEWGTDYTWLYNPADGVVLSDRTDIVTTTKVNNVTETIQNGLFNLFLAKQISTASGQNSIRYSLVTNTSQHAKMTAKFKINSIPESASVSYGFRLQLSNGTSGIMFYEKNYGNDIKLLTYAGTTLVEIISIELNKWYIVSIELNGSTASITVDDTIVYNSTTLATYYCTENRVNAQTSGNAENDNTDVDIAWITFKNYDS